MSCAAGSDARPLVRGRPLVPEKNSRRRACQRRHFPQSEFARAMEFKALTAGVYGGAPLRGGAPEGGALRPRAGHAGHAQPALRPSNGCRFSEKDDAGPPSACPPRKLRPSLDETWLVKASENALRSLAPENPDVEDLKRTVVKTNLVSMYRNDYCSCDRRSGRTETLPPKSASEIPAPLSLKAAVFRNASGGGGPAGADISARPHQRDRARGSDGFQRGSNRYATTYGLAYEPPPEIPPEARPDGRACRDRDRSGSATAAAGSARATVPPAGRRSGEAGFPGPGAEGRRLPAR